jgi:hypothetical protein
MKKIAPEFPAPSDPWFPAAPGRRKALSRNA